MNEYKYFLKLLVAFVNRQDMIWDDDAPDWTSLYRLASAQSLSGVLGYMVHSLPADKRPPEDIAQKLETNYQQTIIRSTQQSFAVTQVEKALCDAGIDHTPYKGRVISSYYPVPELRTMGDVDMLVREEDQIRVRDVLVSMGYVFEGNFDDVWVYKQGKICLEIHNILRYLRGENGQLTEMAGVWEHIAESEPGTCTRAFTKEFQLVLLVAHMVKHFFFKGCGIRLALDIILFLKENPDLDWNESLLMLRANGLEKAFYFLSGYCRNVFHVPVNAPGQIDFPAEQYDKLSDEFLKSNTFGAYDSDVMQSYRMYRREHPEPQGGQTAVKITRRQFIRTFIFMPADKMKIAQPYLNRYPWLLPYAYVYRLVRGAFKKSRRRQTAKYLNFVRNIPSEAIAEAERKAEIHSLMGIY